MLALAMIASALLVRVSIPQGWMPMVTAHGWSITICSGSDPMRMDPAGVAPMKSMHHGSDGHDHGGNDHPCVFSVLALALDGSQPPALVQPRMIAVLVRAVLLISVTIGRGLAAPPPPATGPPAFL